MAVCIMKRKQLLLCVMRAITSVIIFHLAKTLPKECIISRNSQHDVLTNLPNRILFMERLTHVIDLANKNKRCCAVLFLDLDRFKDINDTLGHGVGDQLLRKVSRVLTRCLRDVDTVARLSGDEPIALERVFITVEPGDSL